MGKKKHAEHVNHERWLVSYADFITLLFAFFVVLFASGQADKKKQQKAATAFQNAFSEMALFSPSAKTPTPAESTGVNTNATPKPIELPIDADGSGSSMERPQDLSKALTTEQIEQRVAQILKKQVEAGTIKDADISIRRVPDGLVLSLHEGGFFESGSADLRKQSIPVLQSVLSVLPDGDIRVEGHTDNIPIHSAQYASNWELSSARASTIGRFLLEHSHLNPGHLAVAGYAEFHPIASNATPEGRAKNRRVDVVFLAPQSVPPTAQTATATPPTVIPLQPTTKK